MSIVRRVARPMIAAIFIVQGLDAFRHPGPLAQRSSPLLDKAIPALGLPDDKELLVRANGVTQMLGGAMLAAGFLPRVGAMAIAATLVPTTLPATRSGRRRTPPSARRSGSSSSRTWR